MKARVPSVTGHVVLRGDGGGGEDGWGRGDSRTGGLSVVDGQTWPTLSNLLKMREIQLVGPVQVSPWPCYLAVSLLTASDTPHSTQHIL